MIKELEYRLRLAEAYATSGQLATVEALTDGIAKLCRQWLRLRAGKPAKDYQDA